MNGIQNEELKEGLEMFFSPYLEGYRNRVSELYLDEYSKSSTLFYFMNPVKLHVLLKGENTHLIFTESDEDQIVFIDCAAIQCEEFSVLVNGPEKLKNRFIMSEFGLAEYIADLPYYNLGKYAEIIFTKVNHESLAEQSKLWGVAKADSHELDYRFSKAFQSAIEPSTLLSDIDTDLIIEKVNSSSFSYEFRESVKAYNSGLYLAAAATGGIALENILRQLIKKELGSQFLPDKTYIWKSVDVLTKNEILSGRLRGRINQQSEIRNTNSHTNDDPVTKETVDNLYGVIRDISNLFS